MKHCLLLSSLPVCALLLCGTTALYAQDTSSHCQTLQQGTAVQDTTGCIPLTFKPADGGPAIQVWVPATFIGPTPTGHADTFATSMKIRTLDVGVMGYFTAPDYGHSSNVDTGVFVAYTGKVFGVEADAADTVRDPGGIRESYIVAGPRIQYRGRRYTVYGKAQVGAGHFNGDRAQPTLSGHSFLVENYGAGLEFSLSRHLKLRAIDADYQIWPSFYTNRLTPIHLGSGLALSF